MQAQFSDATYDTLVTFQKTGGSSGLQLVPDLALAMPTVSAGGTRVHVHAAARAALLDRAAGARRRTSVTRSSASWTSTRHAASFLDGISGAAACAPGKLCDLARGITVDDSARTVTFRLTAPDPDFLYKLAFGFTAPVPPYIPARDAGTRSRPGDGPVHDHPLHSRPPRSSSPATRTSGNGRRPPSPKAPPIASSGPSARSLAREAAEIEAGQADWTDDPLPGVAGLSARFPAQVHISPLPEIVYTAFNTRVAPFNDPRVRRAFSLAADRRRFVAAARRPGPGRPDLPDPAARHSRLPALLPVHHRPQRLRHLGRPRPGRRPQARGRVRDQGMRVTVWSDDWPRTAPRAPSPSPSCASSATGPPCTSPRTRLMQAANDSRRRIQATDGDLDADYPRRRTSSTCSSAARPSGSTTPPPPGTARSSATPRSTG